MKAPDYRAAREAFLSAAFHSNAAAKAATVAYRRQHRADAVSDARRALRALGVKLP